MGLEGLWDFEFDDDTSARDTSGNLRDGIKSNSPATVAPGVSGYFALSLNAAQEQSVRLPAVSNARAESRFMWLRTNIRQPGTASLLSYGSQSGFTSELRLQNGELQVFLSYGASILFLTMVPGDKNVTDGEWHHVGFTRTENIATIYCDGVAIRTTHFPRDMSLIESIHYDLDSLLIGALYSNGIETDYFTGQLDNVRLYSVGLSADAVAALCKYIFVSTLLFCVMEVLFVLNRCVLIR